MEDGVSGVSSQNAVGLAEKAPGPELDIVIDRTQKMVARTVLEEAPKEKHAQMEDPVPLMGDGISGVSSPIAVGLAEKAPGPEVEFVIDQPQNMVEGAVKEVGHTEKNATMGIFVQ